MEISTTNFGFTKSGDEVTLVTLKNDNNVVIKITNYGGIITSINVPDKNGNFDDVVLGFDKLDSYLSDHPYFGAICGRYANRIAKGRFVLDGKEYKLVQNNDINHLHGGTKGFDKVVWQYKTQKSDKEVSLILSYQSVHMEEGYPGKVDIEVIYSLTTSDELKIDYKVVTDKKTHINVTNHSYFNLNGCKKDIFDHQFKIVADAITEVDDKSIPLGNLMDVTGTPYDFREKTVLKKQIVKMDNGFDHNYVLKKESDPELILAAEVEEPESGRKMEVYTTEPGVQFYTANYLDGTIKGKKDIIYKKQYAFCLETQHFPDTPNNPEFPTTLLQPGETYNQTTIYKFSLL